MTYISSGSKLTPKQVSTALYTRNTRGANFSNLLFDPAPQKANLKKTDPSMQSGPGAPIVRVNNLTKSAGDTVSVDVFNPPKKRPTMGDRALAGRGESLVFNSFEAKINQGRHMLDSGGRMSQQRTEIQLVGLCSQLLRPYYNQLADEITTIHLAGARGTDVSDWIVPLDTDEEYAEMLVNEVTPPTFDRHFYANDASSLSNLDSTDKFSLDDIDRFRLAQNKSINPLQAVKYEMDSASDEFPFYVAFLSPTQWYDLNKSATAQTLATLRAQAMTRAGKMNHPLFTGECYMHNNVLIKPMKKPVIFEAGTVVRVCTNSANAATTNVTCAVKTERAIFLGAQALLDVYGSLGEGDHFNINIEKTDHGNSKEISAAWMNGRAKTRFLNRNGFMSDFGVAVMDTAVSQ